MEPRNKSITSPPLARPHGLPPRGLAMDTRSPLFEGRFGRLFGALAPADFGKNDGKSESLLKELATAMIHEQDCPKDGADDEEGGIPAAYTYLGQFIDHDITFDPASNLMRQNDPDALVDFRTPRLDLDCVYGRGPDDQPYLYENDKTLVLGKELTGEAKQRKITAHDLPRAANADKRAIIGDPRNDENTIVSQFQGLLLRFHNRFRRDHSTLSFEEVQQEVRFHYQWVVTTDFLARVVSPRVLAAILPHLAEKSGVLRDHPTDIVTDPPVLRFFQPRNEAFIPLEFAAAAYRFGHSMIRPGYRLNDAIDPLPIFKLSHPERCTPTPTDTLHGFRDMNPAWAIDWARFLDIEERPEGPKEGSDEAKLRTQLAYKIDPSLVDPLAHLDRSIVGADAGPFESLATRNLVRGWRMRLPSGQAIAQSIGVTPLHDDEILIGSSADKPSSLPSIDKDFKDFVGKCPLWLYVLAEAARDFRKDPFTESVRVTGKTLHIKTPKLGDVGGTIVTETFGGMMLDDRHSFWNVAPRWKPSLRDNGRFTLRELVRYALGG